MDTREAQGFLCNRCEFSLEVAFLTTQETLVPDKTERSWRVSGQRSPPSSDLSDLLRHGVLEHELHAKSGCSWRAFGVFKVGPDWVRNQADVEIHQLVLIEVPRQNVAKVVLDLGANTVSKEAIGVEEDESSAS